MALEYLKSRELQGKISEANVQKAFAPRVRQTLQATDFGGTEAYDKVFACQWLDHEKFCIGTKDNRLLVWNSTTGHRVQIELPASRRSTTSENCGIHSIDINASQTLLATGGQNPCDVAIFRLPSFEPLRLLSKHEDWLFASAWVTDTLIVTASRDGTLRLWDVLSDASFVNDQPLITRSYHNDKVRDVTFSREKECLATLSHDATCKIWDANRMDVFASVPLVHKAELVCCEMEYPLIAIGSQRFISFIDMRCGHLVQKHIESVDDGWGVRSLSFRDNILTCGGGRGRVSFLDLRMCKYIPVPTGQRGSQSDTKLKDTKSKDKLYFTTGTGTLDTSTELYSTYFGGELVRPAVYAHAYDTTGTKLLVTGGPLPFGLRGCYVSVW